MPLRKRMCSVRARRGGNASDPRAHPARAVVRLADPWHLIRCFT
jgi:hypothetical protein